MSRIFQSVTVLHTNEVQGREDIESTTQFRGTWAYPKEVPSNERKPVQVNLFPVFAVMMNFEI